MNTPEKIANTYLRLNGFFLLPNFTIFDQRQHVHVDFLALRPSRGKESISNPENPDQDLIVFPNDDRFFDSIRQVIENEPMDIHLGAVGEVKGYPRKDIPSDQHINYARKFFGNQVQAIVRIAFYERNRFDFDKNIGLVIVPLNYALNWCLYRFKWLDENLEFITQLTKSGSWSWSEDALGDFLFIQKLLDQRTSDQILEVMHQNLG